MTIVRFVNAKIGKKSTQKAPTNGKSGTT